MVRPGFADRAQLLRWADTVGASADLPRLIRRLILETGSGIAEIGFPAGEGVRAGGWDGTVRATQATPFIPGGLSLWEVSADKDPGTKADTDYEKRRDTPDGTPTNECTYVAVQLRPWTKREEWAASRAGERRWKSVRAFGVDDIETWLEQAPVTHAWLSEHLGLSPHGLQPAESWWQTWSSRTTPALSPELVLAGRGEAVVDLRSRLGGVPQVTTIQGGSREEALAFIAAVVYGDPASGSGFVLPRVALVDDLAAWRTLIIQPHPLVLVPLREEFAQEIPSGCPHHIVVPLIGGPGGDIGLPAIDSAEAAAALRAAGIGEREADEAGRLARTSLLALRRRLANKQELHTPSWARPPVEMVVRRALLGGRWSDRRKGDQAILSSLTGFDYEKLREALDGLATQEDPLLTFVQGSWFLIAPHDAWLLLRRQLRADDLDRFEAAALEVLGELDPALELPPEGRWMASLEGKVRAYSSDLRRGLATTLALLGVHGDRIDAGGHATGADRAAGLVRSLLDQANADPTCHRWSSLSDVLPLLAEAAPDTFLDGVRAGLRGEPPVLVRVFTDKDDNGLFGPSSPHPGLLWALESLAWSPEHFGQAVDQLARLAEIDPGGRLHNRPLNSLKTINCPWHPGTSVSVASRLETFDALRERHPEIAWRLGLGVLPEALGALPLTGHRIVSGGRPQ
jgi:hypothetical protein